MLEQETEHQTGTEGQKDRYMIQRMWHNNTYKGFQDR
jgi:hypothetical protein